MLTSGMVIRGVGGGGGVGVHYLLMPSYLNIKGIHGKVYRRDIYCKFGNFREDFIFAKLRICEVS